jgi:hypothetical protein
LLETDVKLASGAQVTEARSKVIVEIAAPANEWVEAARLKRPFVLLGRRTGGEGDVVELEFRLVDRSATPEKIVASFKSKSRMGERIDLSSRRGADGGQTDGESVDLSLTATRVRFQLDQ